MIPFRLDILVYRIYTCDVRIEHTDVTPRKLTEDQVGCLMNAASRHSMLAHVIFVVTYNAALRRSELIHLEISDFDFSRDRLSIRPAKKRPVDGNVKPVDYPVTKRVLSVVKEWIQTNRLSPDSWLFPGNSAACGYRARLCGGRHLSPRVVANVFDEVASSVNLKMRDRGMHSLRHSRLTELALKTKNPWFVRMAGRHETLSMSDIYVRHLDLRKSPSGVQTIV